ncbi:uncharacterized protein LOC127626552 isoform X2 [Xyrauchen texanus]|uniref:uncharacterized protein LOC127626552 isoform X1 n=1 Tax=Xyrauchen texanus TaxID=154827 RepID=UPI002241EFD7|nr:uncharacterized protein LOC127626552 isoform X1 [Xyrauchen texanus]XP_051958389.1 uncharacterized protein LOC127626552 isoform X2 [Xyrauchen texanus]
MFSQRNKTMGSVRFVLLLILVGTLQIVCGDNDIDKDIGISCADVTGKVGETLNLTCNISYKRSECCMLFYKFNNPAAEICRKVIPDNPCERWTSITCSYTLKVTTNVTLFLQTDCGHKSAEFTVHVSDTETPTNAPVATDAIKDADGSQDTVQKGETNQTFYNPAGITCVTLLLILVNIIIYIFIIFIAKQSKKMREKCANTFRSCMDNEMCDNDDNSI